MNTKMFHPIKAIKEWKLKRAKILNKAQYNIGYNFAAGTMLRGEETPLSLIATYKSSSWCYRTCYGHWKRYGGWNYFDEGMIDAIDYLVDKGFVEDDRI